MSYYKIGCYLGLALLIGGNICALLGLPTAAMFLLSFPAGMGGAWCWNTIKEIRVEERAGDTHE